MATLSTRKAKSGARLSGERTAGRLLSLSDALASMVQHMPPASVCRIALAEAEQRVLASPLIAPQSLPAQGLASVSGYAFSSHDLIGASAYAPAMITVPPQRVAAGEALPEHCDCVVQDDAVSFEHGPISVNAEATRWENIRRAGEDVLAETVLAPPGAVATRATLIAARACGIEHADVVNVCIAIKGADDPMRDLLAGLVATAGATLNDDADITILITPETPARGFGVALTGCEQVAVECESGLTISIPPLYSAALAAMFGLVVPLIDIMSGRVQRHATRRPLTRKIASQVGLSEVVLLRETDAGFEPLAVGSLSLTALAHATHYAMIAAGSEGVAAGESVEAFTL